MAATYTILSSEAWMATAETLSQARNMAEAYLSEWASAGYTWSVEIYDARGIKRWTNGKTSLI